MTDVDFRIELQNFNQGLAPLSHIDSLTYVGDSGHASEMKADVISRPGFLTQSPALSDLTNGTQAGVVDQLIRYIQEQPTDNGVYAIGTTKLFKLNETTVISGGSPSWPQTVTGMTEGESVVRLGANLYGFYNKSSGGDILKMPLSSESITNNWGSVTDQALQSALHPVAVKEDVMVFGNGRYVGVYIEGAATLDVQKLDFGEGVEIADIQFHANQWWIAVNYGDRRSQVYMYDGSGLSNILTDEAGVGAQKIGFLYVFNGVVYVAYTDSTSGGFSIGYINGRSLIPLRYFSGTLPNHRQKTLYRNTITFLSSTDIWSFGASVDQLPAQISKLADGGHATLGGIAAPYGTPYVSSSDGGSNHRVAKFSGYSTDSSWKSVLADVTSDRKLGKIHTAIVYTKALGANAKAKLTLEGNQGALSEEIGDIESDIETTNKTYHLFRTIPLGAVEDVRVVIDYTEGDSTNDCPIRKIVLLGNFVER